MRQKLETMKRLKPDPPGLTPVVDTLGGRELAALGSVSTCTLARGAGRRRDDGMGRLSSPAWASHPTCESSSSSPRQDQRRGTLNIARTSSLYLSSTPALS